VQDIIPGVERELKKISGWLAMLEGRAESEEKAKQRQELKTEYDTFQAALQAFKVGPLADSDREGLYATPGHLGRVLSGYRQSVVPHHENADRSSAGRDAYGTSNCTRRRAT
jgi:hypothetical protein